MEAQFNLQEVRVLKDNKKGTINFLRTCGRQKKVKTNYLMWKENKFKMTQKRLKILMPSAPFF